MSRRPPEPEWTPEYRLATLLRGAALLAYLDALRRLHYDEPEAARVRALVAVIQGRARHAA